MSKITELKNWYLDKFKDFENSLNGESKLPFHQTRIDAIQKFSDLNFPTIKDEEWKFTNISSLLNHNFKPASENVLEFDHSIIEKYLFDEKEYITIVFVNGVFSQKHSNIHSLGEGIVISNLKNAMVEHPEVIEKYLGKFAGYEKNIFTALSTAFAKEGTFIFVKENKIVEKPIQVLFVTSSNEEVFSSPRNLFVFGKNSQAKIIESYVGVSDKTSFTNAVTEVILEMGAVVEHVKVQDESERAYHIARTEIDQERSSNYSSYNVNFGGTIVRNDLTTTFNDEYGFCKLNGLYLGKGNQLIDNHTLMNHAMPHCESHEMYKGILTDKSRGVFNGKIFVKRDAQKTNAYQQNKTLLLSEDATINTKPQLEIFADDVKCSHGATVGKLDKNALFYLRTRGLSDQQAKTILIYAFASDVVHSISMRQVRDHLEKLLSEKLLTADLKD